MAALNGLPEGTICFCHPIDRLRGRRVGVCEHKLAVCPAHPHQREMQKHKRDQTSHGEAPEDCASLGSRRSFTTIPSVMRPPSDLLGWQDCRGGENSLTRLVQKSADRG